MASAENGDYHAMTPGDFHPEAFLRDTWQQRPLLIRNPWRAWRNPLDPDELAGLACEPGIESRLVVRATDEWRLEHGPFDESRFGELGADPWTLLVQTVDHHVPAVAALLAAFRFIPNWRVDDVMVSYATDGGGVGAHFDNYDVFLVQGLGQRRWRLGATCDDTTPLTPHPDLRLLADFAATDEWVLGPGDILYVPPGVAHEGTAVGDDCMTYSIGFRAPARSELISLWAEEVAGNLGEADRYSDPDRPVPDNPGEISARDLAALQDMIEQSVKNYAQFAEWFGCYSTAPKTAEIDWSLETPLATGDVASLARQGIALKRNPASRFAFVKRGEDLLTLFVDGRSYPCAGEAAAFAQAVCAANAVLVERQWQASAPCLSLIADMLNRGHVAFEAED